MLRVNHVHCKCVIGESVQGVVSSSIFLLSNNICAHKICKLYSVPRLGLLQGVSVPLKFAIPQI